MTDFIRTIWQSSAAPSAGGVKVKTEMQPVDQIRLPPQAATAAARPSGLVLEKQRLIKLELAAGPTSAALTSESSTSSTSASASSAVSPDAGKAQRAARRDAVNARRDKRKTEASAVVDMTVEGSAPKKQKTGKTTSVGTSGGEAKEALPMAVAMSLTPEMDPSGEERLRAMEAQLEHLDPDSKEAKKKRRLIRNRMSAQLHRERKKAYVGQLEEQLQSKERELKLMQEKLAAMALESAQLKQKLNKSGNDEKMESGAAAASAKKPEDEVIIKKEPLLLEEAATISDLAGLSFDAVEMEPISPIEDAATPTAAVDSTLSENWAACLESLDDAEMGSVATEDLLSGLDDYPFAGCDVNTADPAEAALAKEVELQQQQQQSQTHHEMHAAKKNLAMMMAMMFSVTFCGQSPSVGNVASGSTFSSMFNAVPVKELSQMNIASRIMASLEKTTWKDFEDVSSWTSAAVKASAAAAAAVAVTAENKKSKQSEAEKAASSPSAASDTTDSSGSCDSPKQLTECLDLGFDTDVIEEFVYPVDASFAPALADTNWFGSESDEFGHSDVDDNEEEERNQKSSNSVATSVKPVSMTSRLYEKLTALWHEKNQVLLTVLDGKNEVTRRSVADMSTIRKGMANGALFPTSAASATAAASTSNDEVLAKNDQSVTFLYPLSAFSADQRAAAFPSSASSSSDAMFLEVSCQLNGASTPML